MFSSRNKDSKNIGYIRFYGSKDRAKCKVFSEDLEYYWETFYISHLTEIMLFPYEKMNWLVPDLLFCPKMKNRPLFYSRYFNTAVHFMWHTCDWFLDLKNLILKIFDIHYTIQITNVFSNKMFFFVCFNIQEIFWAL